MKRVVFIKFLGKRIHLVKVLGVLFSSASLLFILSSISNLVLRVIQISSALEDNNLALQVFGIPSDRISMQVVVGYFLDPLAWMLVWLGVLAISIMIYKSNEIILPIEELERG